MATRHVVVDGSNIATEGRTNPSLKQLREAVAAFEADHKGAKITVVVDATFEHRVDAKERRAAELAEERGEIIAPPAGAIGRGDAFLLKIAQKTGALVLSNDSFQEFHDDHKWLFESGRLTGGKPVPGVGWIFTERTPVRSRNGTSRSISQAAAAEERVMDRAIAAATKELVSETPSAKKDKSTEPINEPLVFIQFIADHKIGTEVRGLVDRFTAHGAFVIVGTARCYIPLTGMGSPPPRSPRSVLTKGERRSFVIKAVNAGRRDIELALPGVGRAKSDEKPKTSETRMAEGHLLAAESKDAASAKRKTRAKKAVRKGVKKTTAKSTSRSSTAKRVVKKTKKIKAHKRTKPVAKRSIAKVSRVKPKVAKKASSRSARGRVRRANNAAKKAQATRKKTTKKLTAKKLTGTSRTTAKRTASKRGAVKRTAKRSATASRNSRSRQTNKTKSVKRRRR